MTTSGTDTVEAPPRPFARRSPTVARRAVWAVRRWRTPRLAAYAPRSTLELQASSPTHAQIAAIDFHTHLGRWLSPTDEWMERDVGRLLAEMDTANVEAMVNLDGRWGCELEANLDRYDRAHPDRFHTFCHVDWRELTTPGGPDRLAESLRRSVDAGARGLKVWKDLGLRVTVQGRRILHDDPMVAPVWETAGELGVPVLVHVADPLAFFLPADRHNERIEEMRRYPRGTRHPGGRAAFEQLLESFERMVATHPRTSFVAAHGYHPENLAHVADLLARYPNLSIDTAAVAGQLGRQPRAARALVTHHPERVLFGTDVFPLRSAAREVYFRLLETADECFGYTDEPIPRCGRWAIYGLDLPDDVLFQVYRGNAARLLAPRAAPASTPPAKPAPERPTAAPETNDRVGAP